MSTGVLDRPTATKVTEPPEPPTDQIVHWESDCIPDYTLCGRDGQKTDDEDAVSCPACLERTTWGLPCWVIVLVNQTRRPKQ